MDAPLEASTALQTHVQPIAAIDTMAEAGRKLLLNDFIRMTENEAGSRSGEDIEHVHDMRVSTRRMRSALRLLEPYFKTKPVRVFRGGLKKVADALGAVRDLDVLIEDLQKYGKKQGVSLDASIALLDAQRTDARHDLNRALDRGSYRRFLISFREFLTTPGAKARNVDPEATTPSQVRHIVPALIYEQLGVVRAYDSAIAEGDVETLHALRIEFKRLRYLIHFFIDVMGATASDYLKDLKAIQDHLGRMQDIQVASDRLEELLGDLDDEGAAALTAYLEALDAEVETLTGKFASVWAKFNSSTVQRKLATALLAL
jgi:CHAD domain-containing protein